MDISSNVEIGEMVTFDPDIMPASPMTAEELVQETKPSLHVPKLQEPQLFLGTNSYGIELIVQDFDTNVGEKRHQPAQQISWQPQPQQPPQPQIQRPQPHRPLQPQHRLPQNHQSHHLGNLIELGDTDSGCSVTTCSDHAEELLLPYHLQVASAASNVPNVAGVTNEKKVGMISPEISATAKRKGLVASTSMSSDDMDYVYGHSLESGGGTAGSQGSWNQLGTFDEEGLEAELESYDGNGQDAKDQWESQPFIKGQTAIRPEVKK